MKSHGAFPTLPKTCASARSGATFEASSQRSWRRGRRGSSESFLEYLPDAVIPFRDARFHGRNLLTVDPTATVIFGEMLLPGRVAYGENHDYTLFCSETEARGTDDALLFCDTLKFMPQSEPKHSPGRLGRHAVLATLHVISRRVPARGLSERLHQRLTTLPGITGGASELPNNCGAWVRILGADSIGVSAALYAAWDEARLALTSAPAPNRRKT